MHALFAAVLIASAAAHSRQAQQHAGTAPPAAVPPPLKLGDRVMANDRQMRVTPVVVLVGNRASFIDAIGAWTPTTRFPVLVDDGTPETAEDIGRFVRAFAPERVVRWTSEREDPDRKGAESFKFGPIDQLTGAVAKAWDQDNADVPALIKHWRDGKRPPPGVVIVNPNDTAWAAGVALAAHRGQVILPDINYPLGIDSALSAAGADGLEELIEGKCRELGLEWSSLADEIDAVTIAANAPAKVAKGGGEFLALTDRIGRPGKGTDLKERWAWCGQVSGDAPRAVYRAMCAIFLQPRAAWLFDGYPDDGPWRVYDMGKAEIVLRGARFDVETLDKPGGSAESWRQRASKPVDAGLVLVNTKGNADFFDLEPGQAKPADVPILARPAIVHVVHSWSALFPGQRHLLAGRWMERGAYAYIGSVHEPYLSAFIPNETLAKRLLLGAPLGAAVRHDTQHLWKIAVFGDPLMTLQEPMERDAAAGLPLEDTLDLAGNLRDLLKDERYEEAMRVLVVTGRDADAAKLAGGLLRDKRDRLSPGAAALMVLPLFRAQKPDDLVSAYRLLDAERAARPDLRDALWLTAHGRLRAPKRELVDLLRVTLRNDTFGRDAQWVATALDNLDGAGAGSVFIQHLRDTTADKALREQLRAP